MDKIELIKEIYDYYYRQGNYRLTEQHREKIENILRRGGNG